MDNGKIIERFKALESERKGSVEQLWDLIERFVVPFRGDFYATLSNENEVDWHRRDVYDSTAVFAVQSLSASLQGNLTSPATQWFDLKFRDPDLNEQDSAMEWLEECAERIYEALQDSNFNIEISEAYIDMVAFGTSILVEEVDSELEEWDGVHFQAIPIREVYFEEDHKKQIRYLYRSMQMTPVQIEAQFGEDIPQGIKEICAKGGAPATERMTIIFSIYYRKDKAKNAKTGNLMAPTERPYGYKYIIKSTGETLGEEGGYYEMPAFVARWRKTAGSRWGHGPAAVAMGDILTLNQLVEAIHEAAAKAIDPATLAAESAILGDLDLDRGGYNVVMDPNGIMPYESNTKFDVGALTKNELVESIRQAFYQDQLQLKESPAMTATEVNVRYEMMQRLLGPTLGRLQNDLLDPLIERTFNIMYRAGQLPEVPEGLTIDQLDIEYTGPLPRAQKMETAAAIQNWMGGVASMAEIYPEMMDLVDVDSAARTIAMLSGVPAKVQRSEEDIAEIREAREEQQRQAQELASAQQAGDAMQSVGRGAQEAGAAMQDPGAQAAMQAMQQQGGQ